MARNRWDKRKSGDFLASNQDWREDSRYVRFLALLNRNPGKLRAIQIVPLPSTKCSSTTWRLGFSRHRGHWRKSTELSRMSSHLVFSPRCRSGSSLAASRVHGMFRTSSTNCSRTINLKRWKNSLPRSGTARNESCIKSRFHWPIKCTAAFVHTMYLGKQLGCDFRYARPYESDNSNQCPTLSTIPRYQPVADTVACWTEVHLLPSRPLRRNATVAKVVGVVWYFSCQPPLPRGSAAVGNAALVRRRVTLPKPAMQPGSFLGSIAL